MTTEIDEGKGEKLTEIIVGALYGTSVKPRPFVARELTVAEKTLTDFDPAAPPTERLYGYATRHFVNVDRFMPLTRFDQEDPVAVVRAAHFEQILDSSGQFLAGLGKMYAEGGVDSRAIIIQAQADVQSLLHPNMPLVSTETIQLDPGVL